MYFYVHDIYNRWTHAVLPLCDNYMRLTGTVDLWDYLLHKREGDMLGGMQGLQGRGWWSGGLCDVVSWHDNMEEPDDFNKVV